MKILNALRKFLNFFYLIQKAIHCLLLFIFSNFQFIIYIIMINFLYVIKNILLIKLN